MSPLLELSTAIRTRRSDMGLTQTSLARLSGLSRATVNQVEKGSVKDLGLARVSRLLGVLGLSVQVSAPRPKPTVQERKYTPALVVAARTASVSYRTPMAAPQLRDALATGEVEASFLPHVRTLLEEGSVTLLAAVVEELHTELGLERAQVWQRMRELARRLQSTRELWS
jgi:transcriptional regulator with XRE-family HTH domain